MWVDADDQHLLINTEVHRQKFRNVERDPRVNMMEPLPERPKGMHWKTYEMLWWVHHEAEMEQLIGMSEWLDK
jgi:hypothetical protein